MTLREWIKKNGGADAVTRLSSALHCVPSNIRKYTSGKTVPIRKAEKIVQITNGEVGLHELPGKPEYIRIVTSLFAQQIETQVAQARAQLAESNLQLLREAAEAALAEMPLSNEEYPAAVRLYHTLRKLP